MTDTTGTPACTVHGTAVYYGTAPDDLYIGWVDQGPTGKWWGQSRYTDVSRTAKIYGPTQEAVTGQLTDLHLTRRTP